MAPSGAARTTCRPGDAPPSEFDTMTRYRPPDCRPLLLPIALIGLVLSACATRTPIPTTPAQTAAPQADPQRMLATIRAAGRADDELLVQPWRDPMVEDLRQSAQADERRGRYAEAAAALEQALAIVPNDPALLQERAEAAILLNDFADAERRARMAHALGAKVGPLCRRHWATVRAVRFAARDGAGAEAAQAQMDACTLKAPHRY